MLNFSPGARVPPHWHHGYEQVIVLEGSFSDEKDVFHKGDVTINPTGSHHFSVYSEKGCIILISWTGKVEFMGPVSDDKKPQSKN